MKTTLLFVISIVAIPIFSSSAIAQCNYTELLSGNKWPNNTVLKYFYMEAGEPLNGDFAAGLAASTWNAIENTPYTFSPVYDINNTFGIISWVTDKSTWGYYTSNDSAAAVTEGVNYSSFFGVRLNAAHFLSSSWSHSCEDGKCDIESVVLHEFGHVLGLKDATSSTSCSKTETIMWKSIARSDCRHTLFSADKNAIISMIDNPAGDLHYFYAIYRDGVVSINWEISECNTDHYVLEKSENGFSGFCPIDGAVYYPIESNSNKYSYLDVSGTLNSIYRLVEIENGGRRIVHAIEQAAESEEQIETPNIDRNKIESYLSQWASMAEVDRNSVKGTQSVTEDWIAIGPVEYIDSDGILSLAYWHNQYGLTTGTTSLSEIESSWDGDLKAYLSYLHENGTKYVFLVGDASDHEYWDDLSLWSDNGWPEKREEWASQPQYDIIPADYFLDQEHQELSMSWWTPYYASDFPKSDVNSDDIPDLAIGRLPAHSVEDVLLYCAKAVKYIQDDGSNWDDDASMMIYDYDLDDNGGEYATTVGMDLVTHFPSEINVTVMKATEIGVYAAREAAAIAEFDEGKAVIAQIGTRSRPYDLNRWLEIRPEGEGGFDISKLQDNDTFPFLLLPSCALADIDRAENPELGRPICERLLFHDSKGAIGIFGPTRGSWQTGNHHISSYVLDQIYEYGVPSLGYACMIAQRELILAEPKYLDLARSYMYLGDPAIRLKESYNNAPPVVTVSSPSFGDYYRTGQIITIDWHVVDEDLEETSTTIQRRVSPLLWDPIGTNLTVNSQGDGTFNYRVPAYPTPWTDYHAAIKVFTRDIQNEEGSATTGDFTIEYLAKPNDEPIPRGTGATVETTYIEPSFPNPFNPQTTIRFALKDTAPVELAIFDTSGRVVITFYSGQELARGIYTMTWNGRNESGSPVSSGIYFLRFIAGDYSRNDKLILLR